MNLSIEKPRTADRPQDGYWSGYWRFSYFGFYFAEKGTAGS